MKPVLSETSCYFLGFQLFLGDTERTLSQDPFHFVFCQVYSLSFGALLPKPLCQQSSRLSIPSSLFTSGPDATDHCVVIARPSSMITARRLSLPLFIVIFSYDLHLLTTLSWLLYIQRLISLLFSDGKLSRLRLSQPFPFRGFLSLLFLTLSYGLKMSFKPVPLLFYTDRFPIWSA